MRRGEKSSGRGCQSISLLLRNYGGRRVADESDWGGRAGNWQRAGVSVAIDRRIRTRQVGFEGQAVQTFRRVGCLAYTYGVVGRRRSVRADQSTWVSRTNSIRRSTITRRSADECQGRNDSGEACLELPI